MKSGLTGNTVLLPSDDVDEYAAFVAGYQQDLAPAGQAECELVQAIADADWRLRRIRCLEFALYSHGHDQFANAFDDKPAESRYCLIQLQTHMTYQKEFRNLNIQEARIERSRAKKMEELLRLQAERRENQAETAAEPGFSDLDELFMPKRANSPSVPSLQAPENGFDFSTGPLHASEPGCNGLAARRYA